MQLITHPCKQLLELGHGWVITYFKELEAVISMAKSWINYACQRCTLCCFIKKKIKWIEMAFCNTFSWDKVFGLSLFFSWTLLKIWFLSCRWFVPASTSFLSGLWALDKTTHFLQTISQHWFRLWLGAKQVTSHYLNQWWLRSIMPYDLTWSQWIDFFLECSAWWLRSCFWLMFRRSLVQQRKSWWQSASPRSWQVLQRCSRVITRKCGMWTKLGMLNREPQQSSLSLVVNFWNTD